MEITDHNRHGQRDPLEQAAHNTTVAMRCGSDMLVALLECFTGTRRPDQPGELPENVLPYPQHVGPRVAMPHPQPASVELCPSASRHPDLDYATVYNRIQQAGAEITVSVRGRKVRL